jgi:hypothetical protein
MSAFPSLTFPNDPKAHGCFGSEEQWKAAVEEQRQWTRQHILVSAASILEVYLSTAITEALWASPEYADRSLAGTSEIEIIRFPDRAPGLKKLIDGHAEAMLKGEWATRLKRIAVIFGILPYKIQALEPRLQKIQTKRNRIAHNFGQDDKKMRRTPWTPMDSTILEVADVEDALVLVSSTIREADLHLFAPIIGGYEFLYEYDRWLNSFKDPFTRPSPDLYEQQFRRHIATKFGSGPDKRYYQALIEYYSSCR